MRFALPIGLLMIVLALAASAERAPVRTAIKVIPKIAPIVAPKHEKAMLLAFTDEETCKPCREMIPVTNELAANGVKVEKHNPNIETALADRWNVSRTPTYIAVRNGRETGRIVGIASISRLNDLLGIEPTRVIAQPTSEPVKLVTHSVVRRTPPISPMGWRLRLFYPKDNPAGKRTNEMIEKELPDLAQRYGYFAATTDEPEFQEAWKPYGYSESGFTLVLIRPDRTRAMYRITPPTSAADLSAQIAAAYATKPRADDCICRDWSRRR